MFRFKSQFLVEAAIGITQPISMLKGAHHDIESYFLQNDITEVAWKALFQNPQYKGVCQRSKAVLDPLRGRNPLLTLNMVKEAIREVEDPEYSMSYTTWHDPSVSYREVEERVLQLNKGAKATDIIDQNPGLRNWFRTIQSGSMNSGHPISMETVGWLRVDEVNKDYLLIDEIQSDLVSAIVQAKNIVESETFEELLERYADNPKLSRLFAERMGRAGFVGMRQHFLSQGLDSPTLEGVRIKLTSLFRDWAEVGLSTLLKLAREEGIGMVLINVEQVFKDRDPNFSSEKYDVYYGNLAQKQGFKPVEINTPEISGKFLGRKP